MVTIAGAMLLANAALGKGQKVQESQGPGDSREVVLDEFTKARGGPEPSGQLRNKLPRPVESGKPTSRQPKYRRSSTISGRRLALPATSPELGITMWRLRPSRSGDSSARLLDVETRGSNQWIPERTEVDTKFSKNDRLRITVESPQTGYLYVIDQERRSNGRLGEAYLIFPTRNRRDNLVGPGRLIDIPAQEDSPSYFTVLRSPDSTYLITFIVLQRPLEDAGLEMGSLDLAILAYSAKPLVGEVERFEMVGGAGSAWTEEERSASAGESFRRLTPDGPAPQTVYRIPRGKENAPIGVTMPLQYDPSPRSPFEELARSLPTPVAPTGREKLGTFKSQSDTLHRAAEALIEGGRYDEARMAMDLAKREEFLDYVRRDPQQTANLELHTLRLAPQQSIALNGMRHHPLSQEESWQKQYSGISDRIADIIVERRRLLANGALDPIASSKVDQLDESLGKAGQAYNLLVAQLFDGRNPSDVAKLAKLQDGPALMEDLRRLSDETHSETVVIYTIVGEKRYSALIITAEAPFVREHSIPRAKLREEIEQFRQVLQNPRFNPQPLAQELYRSLFAPIQKDIDKLGARTLLWVLDDTLRYLPVAALHDGQGYLVERFQNVTITPASNARFHLLPSANPRALGFGVSQTSAGSNPLPAVKDELLEIIADEDDSAGPSQVLSGKVFLNGDFTDSRLKTTLRLKKYSIVHIASHFTFKPGDNTDSQLLIGGGSYLTPALLFAPPNVFAKVDLLVLSACETALGGLDAEGREIESFGVLAQRAGASAVIATLWRVADSSTKNLMIDFYRRRNQAPVNKAEALRSAQLALLKGNTRHETSPTPQRSSARGADIIGKATGPLFVADPNAKYSHPYYWAPFILIGNWR